jgi:hypothetical protein
MSQKNRPLPKESPFWHPYLPQLGIFGACRCRHCYRFISLCPLFFTPPHRIALFICYGVFFLIVIFSQPLHIRNGTIYGNTEANASLRNTASTGAAFYLYSSEGTVQYGAFIGDIWINNGNLDSSDTTIKVVNGVLQ